MALPDVIARIATIESAFAGTPVGAGRATPAIGFDSALEGALGEQTPTAAALPGAATTSAASAAVPLGTSPLAAGAPLTAAAGTTPAGGAGALALQYATSQLGVTEQPPGSNDSPQIAQYRTATAGSGVGPWCAYFVSWAAKQAGAPLGEAGQGFGSVSAVMSWAQRTGRALPAGATPQPGDLIVWGGQHIGIVESVGADGKVTTIEGNASNAVTRRVHGPGGDGATGYVRL